MKGLAGLGIHWSTDLSLTAQDAIFDAIDRCDFSSDPKGLTIVVHSLGIMRAQVFNPTTEANNTSDLSELGRNGFIRPHTWQKLATAIGTIASISTAQGIYDLILGLKSLNVRWKSISSDTWSSLIAAVDAEHQIISSHGVVTLLVGLSGCGAPWRVWYSHKLDAQAAQPDTGSNITNFESNNFMCAMIERVSPTLSQMETRSILESLLQFNALRYIPLRVRIAMWNRLANENFQRNRIASSPYSHGFRSSSHPHLNPFAGLKILCASGATVDQLEPESRDVFMQSLAANIDARNSPNGRAMIISTLGRLHSFGLRWNHFNLSCQEKLLEAIVVTFTGRYSKSHPDFFTSVGQSELCTAPDMIILLSLMHSLNCTWDSLRTVNFELADILLDSSLQTILLYGNYDSVFSDMVDITEATTKAASLCNAFKPDLFNKMLSRWLLLDLKWDNAPRECRDNIIKGVVLAGFKNSQNFKLIQRSALGENKFLNPINSFDSMLRFLLETGVDWQIIHRNFRNLLGSVIIRQIDLVRSLQLSSAQVQGVDESISRLHSTLNRLGMADSSLIGYLNSI